MKKKKKIRRDEFFESEEFKEHLKKKMDSVLDFRSKYKKVVLLKGIEEAGYTTGDEICISTNGMLFRQDADEKEQYSRILGCLFHECGHILFTDMRHSSLVLERMTTGEWEYPASPNSKKIKEAMRFPPSSFYVRQIFQRIWNICEDGRIEYLLLHLYDRYYGMCGGLLHLRNHMFKGFDDYGSTEEKSDSLLEFLNLLLCYSKYGYVKGLKEDAKRSKALKCLFAVEENVKKIMGADDSHYDSEIAIIIDKIWPLIEEKIEAPCSIPETEPLLIHSDPEAGALPPLPSSEVKNKKKEVKSTSEISDSNKNKKTRVSEEELSHSFKKAKRKVSERKIQDELNNENLRIFDSFVKEEETKPVFSLKPITEETRLQYDLIKKEVNKDVAKAVRKVAPYLDNSQNSRFLKRRYYGTKFNAAHLANGDFRYFDNKKVKADSPTLSVCLRIDESGSMRSNGRVAQAKKAAIALFEFCKRLKIRIAIYGDTADCYAIDAVTGQKEYSELVMYPYVDFDEEPTSDYGKRLARIDAKCQNYDEGALRFCVEKLKRENTDQKLLINMSDGEPASYEHFGLAAKRSLKKFVSEAVKKDNITVICAAVGNKGDNKKIREIFGDEHFMDFSDLSGLANALVKAVTRRI